MALDDSIDAIRDLQRTGMQLARLASYAAMGIQPSRQNMINAQHWFQRASDRLEPALQLAEASRVSVASRPRPTFRG
ncbi:hypothetical protein AB4Y43_16865 [Paraburkholderia sp. BR10872]|uniref:hypothetical protein n=1 Tax=Paraburkholderia sp. BR10872 TaxID=3236989 RepID=UPI0034D23902